MSTYTVDPQTGQTYTQNQDMATNPVNPASISEPASFLGLDVASSAFWKGALLGAGVALLVTNETVQKTVVKTVSKVMAATTAGVEELKEKFEDAKAEVEAEASGKEE